MDPLRIAVRAAVGFVFVHAMMRLSGKRLVTEADPASFAVALVVGDLFDDLFWAEVAAAQFVVAVGTLVMLQAVNRAAVAGAGLRGAHRQARR